MNVTVTFRHVDPTPALRQHAEDKLRRLKKYLHRPVDAHVILSVTKDRHTAEVTLNADHESMFAKEVTHDLYSAIDLAVIKLEHQAQRVKERIRTIIGGEDARHPLSDQYIAELLAKEQVDIARRTVAKYRELMGILPSSKRKKAY